MNGFGTGHGQCPQTVLAQDALLRMATKPVWALDVLAEEEVIFSIRSGYHGGLLTDSESFRPNFI